MEAAARPVPTVAGSSPVHRAGTDRAAGGGAPGTMRLNAFPASCDVATANHWSVRRASRCSGQMHAKLATSTTNITTNQIGFSVSSSGQRKTLSRLGHRT